MSAENDIEISTKAENANANDSAPGKTNTNSDPAAAAAAAVKAQVVVSEIDGSTASSGQVHVTNGQQQLPQKEAQVAPAQLMEMQTAASSSNHKDKTDMDATLTNFKVLYVVTQLCGLTMIVLMGSWIGVHLGGLGGQDRPSLEFNWHPLLMTIGLIFLYGNSILIYRGFRTTRKKALKITHASIHMGAFILTVIALKTAFDSHNLATPTPIPNMYSLHSWLGLTAVILFCLQYVAGFMAYMVPGLKETYKIAYMPLHIYFGLFGFVLAIASALMGLTEKAIFSKVYPSLPPSGVMANMCGVLFVIFGGLVVYLCTESSYKRKPIPEDTTLLTNLNE